MSHIWHTAMSRNLTERQERRQRHTGPCLRHDVRERAKVSHAAPSFGHKHIGIHDVAEYKKLRQAIAGTNNCWQEWNQS
jgi:hypothetical protein